MFGTVLDKITSLVGRAFIISAFVPVLLFAAATLTTVWAAAGTAAILDRWNSLGGLKAPASVALFLVAAALAYLLQTISPVFHRLLEGAYPLGPLRRRWQNRARKRFMQRRDRVQDALDERGRIRREARRWTDTLTDAFKNRTRQPPPAGAGAPPPVKKPVRLTEPQDAEKALTRVGRLDEARLRDISEAVLRFHQEGRPIDAVAPLQRKVLQLWDDLATMADGRYARTLTEVRARYAYSEGLFGVQPTELGNIMAATWSYPYTRYGVDATLMWPRLQKVISGDYLRVVEDARISYDALVNLTFLAALYAVVALVVVRDDPRPLALFPLTGAVAVWLFYLAAVEAARGFGAIVRGCFDLYRFPLMQELHLKLPESIKAERATWEALGQILVLSDTERDLPYAHPGQPPAPPAAPAPPRGMLARLRAAIAALVAG